MSISNYAELKILEHTTGKTAWTIPTNVYVKLHTADAGEAGTSSAATETTRKVAAWATAASGSIATSATLEWTNVAATETYSHWSLWDRLLRATVCGLARCRRLLLLRLAILFRSLLSRCRSTSR